MTTARKAAALIAAIAMVAGSFSAVVTPIASADGNTQDSAPAFSGVISGRVFNDLNNNGVHDSGEPYLEDWKVKLHMGDAQDGYNNDVVASDYTDAGGNYYFGNLDAGNYFVEEMEQDGWDQTTSDTHVALDTDHSDVTIDIANVQLAPPTPPYVPEVGGLVVKKVVVGGTATPDLFSFSFDGIASTTFNTSGENDYFAMATGTYNIAETATSTYTASYNNCAGVVVGANATSTCTITNTFVPPALVVPVCTDTQTLTNNVCVDNPAPTVTSNTNGGSGGSGGSGDGGGVVFGGPFGIGFVNTNTGGGLVLGTSTEDTSGTTCNTPLLTTFMRAGKHNDKSEVVKLQTFLNTQLGLNVPVTGFFGSQTTAGVNAFQIKYQNDVLSPWAAYGHDGHTPTGYVYKTTQHEINTLACASLNQPFPQLP